MSIIFRIVSIFITIFATLPAAAAPLLPGNGMPIFGVVGIGDVFGPVVNNNTIAWSTPIYSVSPPPGPGVTVGGTIENRVIQSSLLGTMIFGPGILLDHNNSDFNYFQIAAYELTGYAGWATDVDFRIETFGRRPQSVSRSVDGDSLFFTMGDPMEAEPLFNGPPIAASFPSILTDARNYKMTGTLRIFGFTTTNPEFAQIITISGIAVPDFHEMPDANVPIPASAWMLAGALALMTLLGRAMPARRPVRAASRKK